MITISENMNYTSMAVLLPEQRIDDNFSIYYAEKEFSNKPIDMFEFPLAIAKPESEQEYYVLLKLTQENGIEIYFTVNFRNAVVCSGHYSLLHLCFDYNNETKTLNLEIQKQFLMSKENLDIVSVSIISAPDYNMVQAEYQQMFGKMQEKLSLVCLLFDTGMENQRKFSDACQKVIDNLKEQENLFFCMATFDGKYGIQNISLLGAAQSSQLEVITNEIKKLSLVSSQNTCNPFPQICRQFAQIPLSPSLQITYGILMVTDGQHFPQDTRADENLVIYTFPNNSNHNQIKRLNTCTSLMEFFVKSGISKIESSLQQNSISKVQYISETERKEELTLESKKNKKAENHTTPIPEKLNEENNEELSENDEDADEEEDDEEEEESRSLFIPVMTGMTICFIVVAIFFVNWVIKGFIKNQNTKETSTTETIDVSRRQKEEVGNIVEKPNTLNQDTTELVYDETMINIYPTETSDLQETEFVLDTIPDLFVVPFSLTLPPNATGRFVLDFLDSNGTTIAYSSTINAAFSNGTVNTPVEGTGTQQIIVILSNYATNQQTELGVYNFDFTSKSYSIVREDITAAFEAVGGINHPTNTQTEFELDTIPDFDSLFGSLNENEPVDIIPSFSYASSSSFHAPVRADGRIYTYEADNVLNDDFTKCWCEDAKGSGIGENITLYADKKQRLNEIRIYNGLCQNENYFYKNCRIKECRIEFSNGTYTDIVLDGDYAEQPSVILLEDTVDTEYLKITILSTYPGNKYDDTCVTKIEVSNNS